MKFFNIARPFLYACLLLLVAGCIKDQDFDQADEIVLAPEVELDLLYLNLQPVNFVNASGEAELTEVSQSTMLDFLQEAFLQNDLTRVDFTFQTKNSFTQSFNTNIRFFDPAGEQVYEISFIAPGATRGIAEEATYVEVVEGDDLIDFKRAIRMDVISNIVLNGDPIEGALDFQSKASLYFEFD